MVTNYKNIDWNAVKAALKDLLALTIGQVRKVIAWAKEDPELAAKIVIAIGLIAVGDYRSLPNVIAPILFGNFLY